MATIPNWYHTSSDSWCIQSEGKEWGENRNIAVPIASLTKLVTALTAINELGLEYNEIVVVSEMAAYTRGSSAKLLSGTKVCFQDLLYALLLPSGNDAAVAIAEHVGAKSNQGLKINAVTRFIHMMRKTVTRLHLNSFEIKDPHGLGANKASPKDILTLAKAVLGQQLLKRILSSKRHQANVLMLDNSTDTYVWENTNPLLSKKGFIGGKTGRSTLAGSCLFVWANIESRPYLGVVMGAETRVTSGVELRNLIGFISQSMAHTKIPSLPAKAQDDACISYRPNLFCPSDVERICSGHWLYRNDWRAIGVTANPMYVEVGDLYIDNPEYQKLTLEQRLAVAQSNGAVAALVSKEPTYWPNDFALYQVTSSLDELLKIASVARYRSSAKVTAVTGSVGKTGVKDMIFSLLSRLKPCYRNWRSMNDTWGIPIALSQLPEKVDYAVIEAGLMGRARMHKYSHMINANVVVITSISDVHTEHHINRENIAKTKALLMEGAANASTAVLPRDSEQYELLAGIANQLPQIQRVITFGTHSESTVRLTDIKPTRRGSHLTIDVAGKRLSCTLSLIGQYQAINALAALASVYANGEDVFQVASALSSLRPEFRRGELIKVPVGQGSALVIDDSWSANPASVQAALDTLALYRQRQNGRVIVCLGDMLELGTEAKNFHQQLAPVLERLGAELVYTTGLLMASMHSSLTNEIQAKSFDSAKQMGAHLKTQLQPDDTILVKGSNAMEMWKVIAELIPWGQRSNYLVS